MVEVFAPGNSLAAPIRTAILALIIRVNRDILTRFAITGLWRSTSETALFVSDAVLRRTPMRQDSAEDACAAGAHGKEFAMN